MPVREPDFSEPLTAAPAWARAGLERFEQLQRKNPRDLGFEPKAELRDGDAAYYPNVAQPMGVGVIGVMLSAVALLVCIMLAITMAIMQGSVAVGVWVGMGVSVLGGVVSMVLVVVAVPKGTLRRDGMYLLDEGLVLVRHDRCACYPRQAVEQFRSVSSADGDGSTTSHSEVVTLTNGVSLKLVPSKRPELRETWERWRSGPRSGG